MVGADIAREMERLFPPGAFAGFAVISASKADLFFKQHEQQLPIVMRMG